MTKILSPAEQALEQAFETLEAGLPDLDEGIFVAAGVTQILLMRAAHAKAGMRLTEPEAFRLIDASLLPDRAP